MEIGSIGNFVVQLVFLAITVIGSLWKIFDFINKKFEHERKNLTAMFTMQMEQNKKNFDRVYERMDQKSDEAAKTFVRIDMGNLTAKHLEEKTEARFETVIKIFEVQINNLTKAISDLNNRNNSK